MWAAYHPLQAYFHRVPMSWAFAAYLLNHDATMRSLQYKYLWLPGYLSAVDRMFNSARSVCLSRYIGGKWNFWMNNIMLWLNQGDFLLKLLFWLSFKEDNIHIMDSCFPKVKTLKLDISEILFKFRLIYLICIFPLCIILPSTYTYC